MLLRILALTGIVSIRRSLKLLPSVARVPDTLWKPLSSILLATTLLSLWVAFLSWILKVLRHCRARQMKVALIRCLTMSVKTKMMSKWTKQGSMLAYRALWLLEVLALATQPHACPAA